MGAARYRSALPQLGGGLFLTDGGIETSLIFDSGLELPDFASFLLLKDTPGTRALTDYFRPYGEIAGRYGTGLIFESATWRANADWGDRLGYSRDALAAVQHTSVALLEGLRREFEKTELVISGCIGPRGDGYQPSKRMSAEEAERYHAPQIEVLSTTAADLVTGVTLNYVEEAIGIARAARRAGMPVVLSFTVETDGRLPTGQRLQEAIEQVDGVTQGAPAYYMINCAHPTHFDAVLSARGAWVQRIRGIRANASRKSHAELNEASELDIGDPAELGSQFAALRRRLPQLNVLGGCCGTNHRHVDEIGRACAPLFPRA